jgi:hypothetical protein
MPRPSLQPPSSIIAGTLGLGVFGVNVTTPIAYGKALAQNVSGNNDDYLDVLDMSAESSIRQQ